jgi:hypothetical protein
MKIKDVKYLCNINGSIHKINEYRQKMNEIFENGYSLMSFCIIKEKWYAIFIKNKQT